jgi:hypothetical protein
MLDQLLDQNDPWLMEEETRLDEPSELLLTMPEIRQLFDPDPPDEQLGLRSILDRPEMLSKAWRKSTHAERRHRPSKLARRYGDVLPAA